MNKAYLSGINRRIKIFTAANSYKKKRIHQNILEQQKKNNVHSSNLKTRIPQIDSINRKASEDRLKTEEHKQEQKFYKELSLHLDEVVEFICKIDDELILCYIMKKYYNKTKSNIIEAYNKLDEIHDKAYTNEILEKLNPVKEKYVRNINRFNNSQLNKIDSLIDDYKNREAKIAETPKPKGSVKIKNQRKTNYGRITGIVILGFSFFVAIFQLFIPGIVLSLVPLVFLLYREVKWQYGYKNYLDSENIKRQAHIDSEIMYQRTIAEGKENLLNHPLFHVMAEINNGHPSFEKTSLAIATLEQSFKNKWNRLN